MGESIRNKIKVVEARKAECEGVKYSEDGMIQRWCDCPAMMEAEGDKIR